MYVEVNLTQIFILKIMPKLTIIMLLAFDKREPNFDKREFKAGLKTKRGIIMYIFINILKCIVIGIIWAALLMPVVFNRGGALKYIITVAVITIVCYVLCFIYGGYAGTINHMTMIALISLVLSWIISMAVFEKESKVKSKVIAFTCVISGLAYLVSTFFISNIKFL